MTELEKQQKVRKEQLQSAFSSVCNMFFASEKANYSKCASFHIKPFHTHWDEKTVIEVMENVKLYLGTWVIYPMEKALQEDRYSIENKLKEIHQEKHNTNSETMKRKITDLGENEVINTPTVEEAIEINKTLNPQYRKTDVEEYFEHYGSETCFRKTGYHPRKYYIKHNFTIHPASDFLPTEFYKTVEPKVGQVWECVKEIELSNRCNTVKPQERNTIYKTYGSDYVDFSGDASSPRMISINDLHKFFRFVSEPADKLKMQSNVDPDKYEEIPSSQGPEIAQPIMLVQSPDYVDPRLLDFYKSADPKHREMMREKFKGVEFPKEKVYVKNQDWGEFLHVPSQYFEAYLLQFKNCTPEVDLEKGEIRFVKEV